LAMLAWSCLANSSLSKSSRSLRSSWVCGFDGAGMAAVGAVEVDGFCLSTVFVDEKSSSTSIVAS